jgi:peptidyl-prolyl cis-trans isomerase C
MRYLFAVVVAATLAIWPAIGAEKTQAVTAATAPVATDRKSSDIVARVGDQVITAQELDQTVSAMTRQFAAYGRNIPSNQLARLRYDVLEQMVTHELALQEAKGHESADLDDQVKKEVDATRQRLGGEEAFTNALASMNVSEEEYTKRVREDEIVRDRLEQIAATKIKITPEEVRKFYDDNRDKMKIQERVRASHILIRVPADATDEVKTQKLTEVKSVQTLLKQGEKFPDVARKYSEDPVSAREGGDLGYFTRGQMVPEFEMVAFSLKTNEISDIVTTKFGYHILLITDRQPAGERSFDDVKADIEKYLRASKDREVAAEHAKELRATGKYEILLPKPEEVPADSAGTTPAGKAPVSVETKPVAAPKR